MIVAAIWAVMAVILLTKGAYTAAAVLLVGAGFYGRSSL